MKNKRYFSKHRCTHRATAMETVAMRIGTPQDNLRPWRWFSIHGCRRAGSWMGMRSKATLWILSLKQERERACSKGRSLSYSIDFCYLDLSMTTSQWETYYPHGILFWGLKSVQSVNTENENDLQPNRATLSWISQKLFVGWTMHFNVLLKMGRVQMK